MTRYFCNDDTSDSHNTINNGNSEVYITHILNYLYKLKPTI